jgi:hypothetical protein
MTTSVLPHDPQAPVDRRQLVADLRDVADRLEAVAGDLIAAGEDEIEAEQMTELGRALNQRAGMIAVDLVLDRPAPGAVAGS